MENSFSYNLYKDNYFLIINFNYCLGITIKKVVPSPKTERTLIVPFIFSTIFLTVAKPNPLPGYSDYVCNRLNGLKINSKYSSAIPIPLSVIWNSCWNSFASYTTSILIFWSGLLYFNAFSIKLLKTTPKANLKKCIVGNLYKCRFDWFFLTLIYLY